MVVLTLKKNLGLKSHSHELKVFINNLAYTNLFSIAPSILKVTLWLLYYRQQFVDTRVYHFLLKFLTNDHLRLQHLSVHHC